MTDSPFATPSYSPLAKILSVSGQIAYHWDLKADHIIWFGEWQKLFGYDRDHPPFNSETFAAAIFQEDRALVFGNKIETINRDYRMVLPNGNLLWVHEKGAVESDASGPLRQCGMIVPMAAAKDQTMQPQDKIWHDLDPLTECPSRNYIASLMSKILTDPYNERENGAYLVVGIDRMAFINEAIGTQSADQVLHNAAKRLKEITPASATVGRVGGDMFGILLPGEIGKSYEMIANKILEAFRETAVPAIQSPIFVTMSIGAIRFADHGPSAAEVMIRAEQALNEARLRGRNVMVTYQFSTPHTENRRSMMEMGERFRYALKNDRLRLAYQPVIDAMTGQVVFYEALIRMFNDNGGIIPAADFVPAIEELGLALDLDYYVLDLVLNELKTYPELRLAMNISGVTAARADWPEYLSQKLRMTPNVAKRLIVEITETVAITDLTETQRFAKTLNDLGGSIALDDFGTGYTSIRHLSDLPLAIMKVDKDMLKGVPGNLEQEHLVRMTLAIARGLGIKTVVEGIETEDVAVWLQKEKADMMQGYYFGRPSIERPWISLKGADMPAQKVQALFGGKLFGTDTQVQQHVGSISKNK